MRPSANEDLHFARQEAERSRHLANEHKSKLLVQEQERERTLHFMKCPKCGMRLEEVAVAGVRLDKCSGCGGIWLDKGELEIIRKEESGFLGRLWETFRWRV